MHAPAKPENELARLDALRALNILDTAPEERFDRLTRLAKRLFGVPIALVSLVEANRQWFKSCAGMPMSETSRDISFCGHAILGDGIFMIPDARNDERFSDNPLVTDNPNIRFYAGCPLRASDNSVLGTLCLIDDKPRGLSEEDRDLLRDLASMAEQELAAVHLATMDELTGLSNRRGFETLAQHALNVCHRMAKPAALLFFDLDGFKQINDTHGHAEGDGALVRFAESLRHAFRDSDVVGRLGGDEFVVVLTNSSPEHTSAATTRLRDALAEQNRRAARGYDIRYSVGEIDYLPDRHPSIATLLAEADAAMYARKRSARGG